MKDRDLVEEFLGYLWLTVSYFQYFEPMDFLMRILYLLAVLLTIKIGFHSLLALSILDIFGNAYELSIEHHPKECLLFLSMILVIFVYALGIKNRKSQKTPFYMKEFCKWPL